MPDHVHRPIGHTYGLGEHDVASIFRTHCWRFDEKSSKSEKKAKERERWLADGFACLFVWGVRLSTGREWWGSRRGHERVATLLKGEMCVGGGASVYLLLLLHHTNRDERHKRFHTQTRHNAEDTKEHFAHQQPEISSKYEMSVGRVGFLSSFFFFVCWKFFIFSHNFLLSMYSVCGVVMLRENQKTHQVRLCPSIGESTKCGLMRCDAKTTTKCDWICSVLWQSPSDAASKCAAKFG